MRPITRDTGRVLCEANVLYRGRKQATSEASLTAAESGKLLAHGSRDLHDPRRLTVVRRRLAVPTDRSYDRRHGDCRLA